MKWFKRGAIAAGVLLAILVALPFFISLNDHIPRIEKEVSDRLKEPVTIQRIHAAVLPLPHLAVDGIAIGKTEDIKIGRVTVTPDLFSLFRTVRIIRSIHVDGLVLTQKAIEKIPLWTKTDASDAPAPVRIKSIRLDGALVQLGKTSFGPFDARISINDAGEPQEASITTRDGALKATVKPEKRNFLIDASAKSWKLPLGPPILFDELSIKGVATLDNATLSEISARLYGGTVKGNAVLRWQKGVQLTGSANIHQLELKHLVPLLSPGNKVSGRLDAKPMLSAKAANAGQLADVLHLETPFNVKNGVLYGVDIQKAATNLITKGPTGGETRFDELSGHLVMDRRTYRFTQLRIASGSLAANGNVTISPAKELSGRITAEVKAANIASASVPLNVSGTVQSPVLLPTGGTVAGAAVGTAILGPGIGTSVGAKVGEWTEGLFGKREQKR